MTLAAAARLCESLPEATEQDHHGISSYRVRGKIFVTVPDAGHLHIMLGPAETEWATRVAPMAFEELWWGKKLAGVRADLGAADAALVEHLVREAWRRRAPKALLQLVDASPDLLG